MGDTVRRLLYPLVLPFIVATVWAYALMMDQHAGPAAENPAADRAIAGWTVVPPFAHSPTRGNTGPGHGYGFSSDADGFATAADIDE